MQTCDACAFWRFARINDGLCHRRAPAAAHRPEIVAHWPQTERRQGCGDGEPAAPGRIVTCVTCVYWRRSRSGLQPMNRSDMPNAWWRESGVCLRHAPDPSPEPGPRAFWRATSAKDGCGEGQEIKADIN